MRSNIFFFVVATFMMLFLVYCAPKKPSTSELIATLEKELFDESAPSADKEKLLKLVDTYVLFAENHPGDTLSADYLFKAADIAMNIGYPQRSIELLSMIQQQYPEFDQIPETYFLMGFVYENNLNDLEKASELYRLFIEKFPNHELADDAAIMLEYLGKTPEELIREFEKKQQTIQ